MKAALTAVLKIPDQELSLTTPPPEGNPPRQLQKPCPCRPTLTSKTSGCFKISGLLMNTYDAKIHLLFGRESMLLVWSPPQVLL